MNTFIVVVKHIVLAFCIMIGVSACAQAPKAGLNEQVSCTIADHKQLKSAIDDAHSRLSHHGCHYQFDSIHKQLLAVAQNAPDKENKSTFLDFYRWSVKQDIVTKRQSMKLYNRYFTKSFAYLLKNDRNVCSIGSNGEKLIKDLERELQFKKIGLMNIMQDRDAYFKARNTYTNLAFLIETTLRSCAAT